MPQWHVRDQGTECGTKVTRESAIGRPSARRTCSDSQRRFVFRRLFSALTVSLLIFGGFGILVGVAHAAGSNPDGGCTQYVSNSITNVVTSPMSTNATVAWSEAYPAPTILYWGNTSNPYPFQQTLPAAGQFSPFLDYLEPNTTHYFKIYAQYTKINSLCVYAATKTSSFTTGSDASFIAQSINDYGYPYIFGTVYNANGHHAGSGIVVTATCVKPYILSTGYPWNSYDTTDSNGRYWISIPPEYDQWAGSYMDICQSDQRPGSGGAMGYLVCLDNIGATSYTYCGASSGRPLPQGNVWPGYWNETVVTWAPQVVAFQVSSNFVTGPIVQIADFSNANASHGFPDSSMGYSIGTIYTTSSSHCWTALWVFSGCSSASNAVGTSTTYSANGHNLVVTQQLWESGNVLFDAFSRQWSMASENYYKGYAPPVNEPASWPIQDTMVPGNSSLYPLYAWGGQYNKGVPVYLGSPDGGQVTVKSTSTSYQVKGFSIGVSVGLYGVGIGTTVVTDQWSQTGASTSSNTLFWTVYGNSQTVPICYVVYGVGGSSSASSTTADAVGIWAYAPTYSGGTYSCPIPT
jgi:hypothetical protein